MWNHVAQYAHNHLARQILPHVDGTCACRKPSRCKKTLLRNVRLAVGVMETYGANPLESKPALKLAAQAGKEE